VKFYILRSNSDPDVLGVSNGIKQADIVSSGFQDTCAYEKAISILGTNSYFDHVNEIESLDFNLQCVQLLPDANLTSFLLFGPHLINCPYLISQSVKDLLSSFNFNGVKLWPASVKHGIKIHDYYLMHVANLPDASIDFSRSIFYSGNALLGKKAHKFKNETEKKIFTDKNYFLEFDTIFMNEKFDHSLDFFQLSNTEIIISSKLKEAMETENFSGIRFLPAYGEVGAWLKFEDDN
jgi:hypothetical protein